MNIIFIFRHVFITH